MRNANGERLAELREALQARPRVSLANLPSEDYPRIGKAISDLLEEYHGRWQASH